ncbi:MAG: hypothetical protein AAGF11_43185 [Myxococcota bacterium]
MKKTSQAGLPPDSDTMEDAAKSSMRQPNMWLEYDKAKQLSSRCFFVFHIAINARSFVCLLNDISRRESAGPPDGSQIGLARLFASPDRQILCSRRSCGYAQPG